MLEVMNAGSTDLSRADAAMILNCWEKSSTPLIKELEQTVSFAERKCGDLMQQLHFYKEYYEKWIHSEKFNPSTCQKKKFKRSSSKTVHDAGSSSENEFEKVNRYFYKKIKNKISEMNAEITQANRKIHSKRETERTVIIPKPSYDPFENLKASENFSSSNGQEKNLENKACKSEPVVLARQRDECNESNGVALEPRNDNIKVSGKISSKSVPVNSVVNTINRSREPEPSKRRFSNLQRFKLRSKSLPQGVRRKFGFGGFFEIIDSNTKLRNSRSKSRTSLKVDSCRSFKTFKSEGHLKKKQVELKNGFFGKLKKNRPISARSLQCRKISNKHYFLKNVEPELSNVPKKNSEKVLEVCNSLGQNNIVSKPSTEHPCKDLVTVKPSNLESNVGNLNHLISKPNTLVPFLRQPIPFIPCSSTSKTFNLGLNVQQVLSMIKHRKHSITLQTVIKNGMKATRSIADKMEPTVNTLFFSHTTTSSQMTSALCPARTCIEDSYSIITNDIACRSNCSLLKQAQAMRSETLDGKAVNNFERETKFGNVTKLERPEDVWVVEQPDEASRGCERTRSRCTCYPSKHCVDYQKVLREYTGWRMPSNKNPSMPFDNYSTYEPILPYQKPKLCSIPSQENVNWNVKENARKIELIKVQNDLMNLNRRYSCLEEQISQRNLDDCEAIAELNAMENELTIRETEFKDIINFYQQLIQLKEKLKTLRLKSLNTSSQAALQQVQRPKKDPLRPTPSMALTKLLRKIQGLQDKIKLIDAP